MYSGLAGIVRRIAWSPPPLVRGTSIIPQGDFLRLCPPNLRIPAPAPTGATRGVFPAPLPPNPECGCSVFARLDWALDRPDHDAQPAAVTEHGEDRSIAR